MKAVILAGGEGTRLYPLTVVVTNKHLLPLYNKPVISYAVDKLVESGIKDIMIISSPQHIGQFVTLFDAYKECSITYGVQRAAKGIADGLRVAKDFIGTDNCLLWLGDGIVEDDIRLHIKNFTSGSKIFLKAVPDPSRFGVAHIDAKGRVTKIVEKPKKPKSNLAVVGVYLYDNTVFDKMKNQPLSLRGEYEITYVNNKYIEEGSLEAAVLRKKWFDIGTFESLFEASSYMRKKELKKKRT